MCLSYATWRHAEFLCELYSHFLSVPLLSAILKFRHRYPSSLLKLLKEKWLRQTSEHHHNSQRLWVDYICTKNLPLLVINDATLRLLRLFGADTLQQHPEHILKSTEEELLVNSNDSPFSLQFLEILLSPLGPVAAKNYFEQFTLCLDPDQDTNLKLCCYPSGLSIDSVVWIMTLGPLENRRHILYTSHLCLDRASTFMARISRELSPSGIGAFCSNKAYAFLLNHNLPLHFRPHQILPEIKFVEMVRKTWLGANPMGQVLFPTDTTDLPTLVLLTNLIWLNIPVLRERVSVAFVSPCASSLRTSLRLLLPSLNDSIREAFIQNKVSRRKVFIFSG